MTRRAALAIVAVGVLAGCNDAAGVTTRTGGSAPDYPTFGPAPDVSKAAEAVVTKCEVVDGTFEMEVVVTNTSSHVRFLQGAEYVIVTRDGGREEGQLSGPGYDLGSGRQRRRFWHEDSNGAAFAGSTCEAGPTDFRDPNHVRPGTALPPDSMDLAGCTGEALGVTNPTDEPIGVFVAVELFDADGLSLTRTVVDFRPKVIDDRSRGGTGRREEGGTLAAGERRIFDVTPEGEFDDLVSCAVTDASYETDPETEETVIVG